VNIKLQDPHFRKKTCSIIKGKEVKSIWDKLGVSKDYPNSEPTIFICNNYVPHTDNELEVHIDSDETKKFQFILVPRVYPNLIDYDVEKLDPKNPNDQSQKIADAFDEKTFKFAVKDTRMNVFRRFVQNLNESLK
jgi:hypothetical protein